MPWGGSSSRVWWGTPHCAARRARCSVSALCDGVTGLRRNGTSDGHPGCLNVTLPGLDAADLLLDLPDLAVSTGSACSALSGSPSHVLRAIGLSAEEAHGSLRFGLGRGTTEAEVDAAAAQVIAALRDRGHPGVR